MLLNIYLGTTIISCATTYIFSAACEKKFKREGYRFIKENKSLSEKIAGFISTAFKCSIPVYNILNAILILCMGDKVFSYVENELLQQGKIYKPIKEESVNDFERQGFDREKDSVYTPSIQTVRIEKKYEEMTNEEKLVYLQEEKEKILNQITHQTEKSFTLSKRKK